MSSDDSIIDDLKETILEFIVDMKDNVFTTEDEKADMMLVEFFFRKHDKTYIMKHAIDFILPWKKKIKARNDNFFIENRKIFAGIPEDRIDYFSSLWTREDKITQDDKDAIWEYFDTIIDLIEQYRKNK